VLSISTSPGETNLLLYARMHREFFAYNCRQPPTLHTGHLVPGAAGTFLVRPTLAGASHAASLDPYSAPPRACYRQTDCNRESIAIRTITPEHVAIKQTYETLVNKHSEIKHSAYSVGRLRQLYVFRDCVQTVFRLLACETRNGKTGRVTAVAALLDAHFPQTNNQWELGQCNRSGGGVALAATVIHLESQETLCSVHA
jgi:hypothetical protein